MPREEVEKYEQDRHGNVHRELDSLRAQGGMRGADADDEGILQVLSDETASNTVLYSIPTDADQVIVKEIHAHNSEGSDNTFQLLEAQLDNNGNITSTTRRSINYVIHSNDDEKIDYHGRPFTSAVAVNSEFAGEIGVAVIEDHKESSEPDLTQ